MQTLDAIAKRKSVRNFSNKQVPEALLNTILKAAVAAPAAHAEYHSLHLTVVQDPDVLANIVDTAMHCFRDPIRDIYYGAPTVIVISTNHCSIPELDMTNAGTIAQNILLAATDLGVDSCIVWGTVLAARAESELIDELELPDGFVPVLSVALGYSATGDEEPFVHEITLNRV